jgi:hypothetical protein
VRAGEALRGSWGTWARILATCASAQAPVHGGCGEGRTDREGPRHRERKKGQTGQRLSAWQTGPARQRGKRGARAKGAGADRSAPASRERERERERESVRERKLPLTGGSHLSGGAGAPARPGWAELGCFSFFFFSGFSNSFSISFL